MVKWLVHQPLMTKVGGPNPTTGTTVTPRCRYGYLISTGAGQGKTASHHADHITLTSVLTGQGKDGH